MSILQFFVKRCKKSAQKNAIDFKLFLQEKYGFLYAITCLFGKLDEKINNIKILKFWNKGLQGKWFFLKNHLASLYPFNSKFLNLDANHMSKNYSCKKNMFSWF